MNKGKYILVNGTFVPTEEYRISLPESDGFLFSEKIRSVRTAFPFFKETLDLIKRKLRIFGQSFADLTASDGSGLKRQLERTLTKNKHFLGAVFIVTFRFSELKIHYTIQSEKLENTAYELNEKGLYVEAFDEIKKPASIISMLSIGSEIYWNIARNQLTNPMTDHFLIINTENHIVEISESNIYVLKGKTVRGASIAQGAYLDVTRPLMLKIFSKFNLEFSEEPGISLQDIREADEILIVNAIDGIRWIVGFEGKRFFNHTIRKISEEFNQSLTN
jgi:branched-subunit amino acid aminotransferase/4-amino-4-deoxychorismate lyase